MNLQAIRVMYTHEMSRFLGTMWQSLVSPVISTSLYFIVFGSAIGSRIQEIDGVSYGTFIVPGMLMLALLTQSVSNASFGIFFQKFTGTIYEVLSAPISPTEILIGFIGASVTKSLIIGIIIILTAGVFVDLEIKHPWIMLLFLILVCVSFSMFGFILGLLSKNFEQLNIVPILLLTPLVFLGGSFYSIKMLPDFWQTVSLFNPLLYLISGLRWSFFEISDVDATTSLLMIFTFLIMCLGVIIWIFRTGYKLKA